ncbi:MAG: YkgJ family cysteine cluster protein [Acidobacteriaceae bacterium]
MPCKLGCGKCCVAIKLTDIDVPHYQRWMDAFADAEHRGATISPDVRHLATHFTRITKEQAVRRNQFLKGTRNKGATFYTCDWYDEETKLCLHHDQRPPMCSRYPFYGGLLGADFEPYTPDCGYLGDIGKTQGEVDPLEPVLEEAE